MPDHPKISLCMIVRDEAGNLSECLKNVSELVDETIVVDTGSKDRTKEIALESGARVFDFPWADSFSAARNHAIEKAAGKWIFWMDAGDRIGEANRKKLEELFSNLPGEPAAYSMNLRIVHSTDDKSSRIIEQVRLFPNDPKVRWRKRVHEEIIPALTKLGVAVQPTDIVIRRKITADSSARAKKRARNLNLLELEHKDDPENALTLYKLGNLKERMGDTAAAAACWRRCLVLGTLDEEASRKLYLLLAQTYLKLGQKAQMLTTCLIGLALYPNDPDLLFSSGELLPKAGETHAAAACLNRLLKVHPTKGLAVDNPDRVRSFKARAQLGQLYCQLKRFKESETQFRHVLERHPEFAPAWIGLGQVLLELGRAKELNEVIIKLHSLPEGKVQAVMLRALWSIKRKEHAEAVSLMEEAVVRYPSAVEPRMLLGHLLWRDREHKPWVVERALRNILELDPTNAEAKRRLEKLYSSPNTTPAKAGSGGTTPNPA